MNQQKQQAMPDIKWKLHLRSSPVHVFAMLNSKKGREQFWAESAPEEKAEIHFNFINGLSYCSKIISRTAPDLFEIDYFNSRVSFELSDDGVGGTDLILNNYDVAPEEYLEVHAGWVSVLMALKAAVDFGVDLRNHDAARSWDHGFVDN